MTSRYIALVGLLIIYGFILLCCYGVAEEAINDLREAWYRRHRERVCGVMLTWSLARIAFGVALAYTSIMWELVPGLLSAPPL